MRRPSTIKRMALGWIFLNVLAAGAMPAVWFMAPGRTRWAWEFARFPLGLTAHDLVLAAMGAYALGFALLWVSFLDRPDDWL